MILENLTILLTVGRLYLRDTLESEPVYLKVLYPPSHAQIKVANDVR